MTDQEFLNADPDRLTHAENAVVAEALLLCLIPCHFCGYWTPQRFEIEFYLFGGCEVCDSCEELFQQGRR